LIIRFPIWNPQAGNFRLCGVSSVEPGKLSLPSSLYGNPWFRVTPSFLSHLQPSASHTAERRQPFERRDASPLPLSRTLTPISWLALLAYNFVAPPCPHCPQWGLRSNPKLSAPSPCQELSSSFVVQLAPLRASSRFRLTLPGSLDSGRSKQTVAIFCVRYSVRSFLAPVNNLKMYITFYIGVIISSIAHSFVCHFESKKTLKKDDILLAFYTCFAYSLSIEG
jgi:hypothetical protein